MFDDFIKKVPDFIKSWGALTISFFSLLVAFISLIQSAKARKCKFRTIGTLIPKLAVHPFRSDRFAYSGENGTASPGWIS